MKNRTKGGRSTRPVHPLNHQVLSLLSTRKCSCVDARGIPPAPYICPSSLQRVGACLGYPPSPRKPERTWQKRPWDVPRSDLVSENQRPWGTPSPVVDKQTENITFPILRMRRTTTRLRIKKRCMRGCESLNVLGSACLVCVYKRMRLNVQILCACV